MKKKIVVCDHINEEGLKLLASNDAVEMVNYSDMPKDELLKNIADFHIAITRSSTDVDVKFLESAPMLEAVVRAGVGVDNVDIEEASKRGVIIMNVPTANTIAAVELTMSHMLSCVRKFPYAHNNLKLDRVWKREAWYGTELSEKKLGIIGFGNIGSRVGVRSKAFGMEVVAYDPYIHPSKALDLGVKYTNDFNEILACDIITIHTPKNDETVNMIGQKEIDKMKDGVILINCARGGLYNEDALYEGLKSGKIAMAGLDVFIKEPATSHKLLDLPNIIVTPHLGANTLESQTKIAISAAEQAIEAARGESYPNALNLPIKGADMTDFIKPYLELVQKLGYLAAQINKGPVESIKLNTWGDVSSYSDSLLTFATVGALKDSKGDKINYVNVEFVANESGIKLSSNANPNNANYKNQVSITLGTPNKTVTIKGSVFDEDKKRIVEIDGYPVDIEPKGKMIFFSNSDVPGVIGKVGTLLAEYKINISDFRLSRDKNKTALALIVVDDDVSQKVIDALAALPECKSVSYAVI